MIGLAVIGLGPAVQPHAKALAELTGRARVVWAATRSQARADAFAATSAWPVTTDIAAAIADPAVQAVLVLTPPSQHLAVAQQAFSAGRHVLVEKPLELTSARAASLVAAADMAGRHLGVVLQHRFRERALALKELLASGRLGAVQAASMTVPWWRPQAYYDEPGRGTLARDGGGVLLTQAIHTLDLFRALLGVRRVVAAQVRTTALHRMETEDHVHALVELANGAPATLSATTAAYPGRPESIEVIGALGTARLEGNSLHAAFLNGSTLDLVSDARTGAGAGIMDFDHGPHRALIADFLDAIEHNRPPAATGADALATQRLIDDILARAAR
jgi:predicted dehydrogenase